MFKFGEKMPDNFFNLATEIKVNRVGRAYFVIDSDDLNHRFTLKNMIIYFKDEKLL
jgi:hypothetical protein